MPDTINSTPSSANNVLQKLAGFQSVIPQFDNITAVTPHYFIETLENITSLANSSDAEKLLILKSRIRGDPLTHIINSPDFSNETNYDEFKRKFLDYFATKTCLATRQQQFSNCRMNADEPVKQYAARVANCTLKFLGDINLANAEVKSLFEQTKLSKFLDGLLPQYKQAALTRDPQNFQDAVNFVELLQANESYFPTPTIQNIQNTTTNDFSKLLETHTQATHECIAALSTEIENLKIKSSQPPPRKQTFQRSSRTPFRGRSSQRYPQSQTNHNDRNYGFSRFNNAFSPITCIRCGLPGHTIETCNVRLNPNPRSLSRERTPFRLSANTTFNSRPTSRQFNDPPTRFSQPSYNNRTSRPHRQSVSFAPEYNTYSEN